MKKIFLIFLILAGVADCSDRWILDCFLDAGQGRDAALLRAAQSRHHR
jgi:Prokaryotic membrane lipoprotein lipid attachment site